MAGDPDLLINAMLMVSTAARPRDFLCRIDRHPDVAAPPPLPLEIATREIARTAARAAGAHLADAKRWEFSSVIDRSGLALASGTAFLGSVFDHIRQQSGKPVVLIWDSQGMMFPLLASRIGLRIVVLESDPDYCGRALTFGPAVEQVARHISDLRTRNDRLIDSWMVPAEHVCRIDVDGQADSEVFRRVLAFLGVDATSEMVRTLASSSVNMNGQD